MPVLTKINTNSIADDAVTGAKIPTGAVQASEIAAGGVSGADIGYLGDGSGNLSGTITNQQLHFGSAFTLTDDLTVNGDVTLGKVRDDGTGQSITGDGKTITGTGTLTMGGSFEGEPKNRTNERASGFGDITTGNVSASGNLTVTGDFVPSSPLSNRNMIINGAMQVWQRATAATAAADAYHTVDRWKFNKYNDGAYTSEKYGLVVDEINTTGHSTALKLVCTTADASLAGGQYAYVQTNIEGQDLQHLQYGSANAKTITLSFWIKSNKTGIYTILLRKMDTTGYFYPKEYTINTANTWEQKTITITPTAGSTSLITSAAGKIDNDSGSGIMLQFGLAWGSNYNNGTDNTWATSGYSTTNQVNWMDTLNNNLYITGVQLELGSNATPFEHRSYTEEFFKCNRYYTQIATTNDYSHIVCWAIGNSNWYGECRTKNALRASPTVVWGGSGNWTTVKSQTSGVNPSSSTAPTIAKWVEGHYHVILASPSFSGLTDGGGPYVATFGSARTLALDAEL